MTVGDCRPGGGASASPSRVSTPKWRAVSRGFARAGLARGQQRPQSPSRSDVPPCVPEVNHDHLALVEVQKRRFAGGGFIVTNPNCSTVGLVMALAPLHAAF